MSLRPSLLALGFVLVPAAVPLAASDTVPPRLLQEFKDHPEAPASLEYLCDVIGPRLTGSERLVKAHDWAEAKMKAYGLVNVRREAYDFARAWSRGEERARLLSHNGAALQVAQVAWSPATPGPVRGEVLLVAADKLEALTAQIGHFSGKILLMDGFPRPKTDAEKDALKRVLEALATEKPLALLMSAHNERGHLTMFGSPKSRRRMMPALPFGLLRLEHAQLIQRLLARGEKVEMELNLGGALSEQPVQAYNSMGEIRGAEKPEEVVILGAHMDSWDLGAGATDNGTGVASVLEALRGLQASGLKPKRTIRVILFSGEEQGLLGSEAYVKAHAAEMSQIQAVLVQDLGGRPVRGFALENREDLRPLMARLIAPLKPLGVTTLPEELFPDQSDFAPFQHMGVPAFFADQDTESYFADLHHSEADTYDHVDPKELEQSASIMAAMAWQMSQLDQRLPHAAPAKDAAGTH